MPGSVPRILLAGRTRADRKRRRAGIRLRDYSITNKTRERYEAAVGLLLPHLEAQPSLADLDGVLCDWIEWQWSRGESLGVIGDNPAPVFEHPPSLSQASADLRPEEMEARKGVPAMSRWPH